MRLRRLLDFCLCVASGAAALGSCRPGAVAAEPSAEPGVWLVSDQEDFDAAVNRAAPGDTLVMKRGVWTDVTLDFRATGWPDAPITLRAETPGEVILSGASRLRIAGRHLVVAGLLFQDVSPAAKKSSPVVEFRRDKTQSHDCRLTSCAIIDFNPSDKEKDTRWVSIYGTRNRVDHCRFHNKTNLGPTLVVWLNDPPGHQPNEHQIDHNCFSLRPELRMNGAETIRVGDSPRSMLDSRTLVEANYFYRCDGEGEIISNKSCENIYRANTFAECAGALTLRHGNRCTVEGNFFLGNEARLTGGVRVCGEGHRVIHNYFGDLEGDDYRAALTLMEGIRDSELSGYFQVKRALVASNTFVNNRQTFNFGYGAGRNNQTMPPMDCTIADNVVLGGRSPLFTIHDPATDVTYDGNVMYGAALGLPPTPGILEVDPKLIRGADHLWRPAADSPILGAAQRSDKPAELKPLTPGDVGPSWLNYEP